MPITWSNRRTTKRMKWKLIGGHYGTKYAGRGRYYKRAFHKAERKAIRNQLRGLRIRKSFSRNRSEINWKGW